MKPTGVADLNAGFEMNEFGVADFNVFVKMKPNLKKMKRTEVSYPDAGVIMNETGVTDFDAFVKMNPTE